MDRLNTSDRRRPGIRAARDAVAGRLRRLLDQADTRAAARGVRDTTDTRAPRPILKRPGSDRPLDNGGWVVSIIFVVTAMLLFQAMQLPATMDDNRQVIAVLGLSRRLRPG